MSEPQDQDTSTLDSASLSPKRLLFGALIVVAFGACLWAYFGAQARNQQTEVALADALGTNEKLRKQMANLKSTMDDIKAADLYRRQDQTLAKDELSVILDRTEQIHDDVQQLADAQTRWKTTIDDLKESQTGRRIASDPALVELLATILDTAPTEDASEKLGARLQTMTSQLREALAEKSVSFKPSEAFLARIKEIEESVSKSEQWYRDHLLQLDALAAQSANLQPAERTLRAALLSLQAERAQKRVETLAERNRQIQREKDATVGAAEAEAQRIIAEAEAEAKRLVGDATAARIKQAALEEKAKQEEEIRKRKAAEKLAQLKREYQRDLPDIKIKLQPFLADGDSYNGETGRKGPVSLSVLRSRGALESGRKGLEKLLYVGGTNTNDRKRGAFPQYVGSEFAWRQLDKDFIVKAQDYLNKYGDLMVEEGLLAK